MPKIKLTQLITALSLSGSFWLMQGCAMWDYDEPDVEVGAPEPVHEAAEGPIESYDVDLVFSVQAQLKKLGFYEQEVDGFYDLATAQAVRRFQNEKLLSVTGRLNEATLESMGLSRSP